LGEPHEVTRSAALIGALTMVSRVLGMVRDMIIARIFAAGAVADSYFVALSFPATMARLLGDGGFTISFVPIFTEELEKKGREEAMKLAYTAFWAALALILLITAAGMIFAPWVVRIIAPGFEQEAGKMAIATRLTRQIFPYTIFICMTTVAMGILNSFKHFAMPALSPVLLNISVIASVLILNVHYHFAPTGVSLVIGVLAGGLLQVAAQLPTLWRHGFRFRPYLDLRHPGLVKTAKLMGMAVIGVMVYQLNFFINTFFVSSFPGGRSYIYYADRLVELPLAIFGIALGTALLPRFSSHAARNDLAGLGEALGFGLNYLAFMIIPSYLGLILFRAPIISVIYQGANFTAADA
jgi:putative peptidoglycan lipid II flippase